MAEFLQLQGVEPRDDAGCFDDPGDGGVVERPGAQRGAQHLEVLVVAFRVVAEEAELVVTQGQALLQPLRPAGRLQLAEAFDHEHRAEQVDGIRQAGPVKDKCGQRGGTDVGGGHRHRPRVAADCREVAFQQLIVAMFGRGVLDSGAAQPEQLGREVRGGE